MGMFVAGGAALEFDILALVCGLVIDMLALLIVEEVELDVCGLIFVEGALVIVLVVGCKDVEGLVLLEARFGFRELEDDLTEALC